MLTDRVQAETESRPLSKVVGSLFFVYALLRSRTPFLGFESKIITHAFITSANTHKITENQPLLHNIL